MRKHLPRAVIVTAAFVHAWLFWVWLPVLLSPIESDVVIPVVQVAAFIAPYFVFWFLRERSWRCWRWLVVFVSVLVVHTSLIPAVLPFVSAWAWEHLWKEHDKLSRGNVPKN